MVSRLDTETGVTPGLAVVLVGDDPASATYVAAKERDCAEVGITSIDYRLDTDTTQEELIGLIGKLKDDAAVHGILVQMPLPSHLDEAAVIETIGAEKDVDGFHAESMGKLLGGDDAVRACTPRGVMELLDRNNVELAGKRAVVVGRSNTVGKPQALMLLERDATVTVCHSRTSDLPSVCHEADVLVAAVGRPKMIDASYVKPGAVVIDVGINRTDEGLVGDVDFEAVKDKASLITPVPGGVGPMTRAMLMKNTVEACARQIGFDWD
jgi:methylenetetrahydrofolate dehydrogenase (NADP+)/methenyltetrahydrofolate cyclohydrolase